MNNTFFHTIPEILFSQHFKSFYDIYNLIIRILYTADILFLFCRKKKQQAISNKIIVLFKILFSTLLCYQKQVKFFNKNSSAS